MHTTNYRNTLILPSEDCKAQNKVPTKPESVAGHQFSTLDDQPYGLTSDDLLVDMTAKRRGVPKDEHHDLRAEIFSKGQPCLRASPLVKTHGWAVHHDDKAGVAVVAIGSDEYTALMADDNVTKLRGMRNKRA